MTTSTITSWSPSRSKTYDCPFRAKLAYVDRIPEPDRGPPPPGLDEWHNDRGSRVHDYAEHYVRGNHDEQIPEMAHFAHNFDKLRELYPHDLLLMEDMWAFDREWNSVDPTQKEKVWLRAIIDCLALNPADSSHAVVIDYKTGKRAFNEIDHARQMQLYQLCVFLRFPDIQLLDVELWYLDHNLLVPQRFRRHQGLRFFDGFNQRGIEITTDTTFEPKPTRKNCMFCPFKTGTIGKNGVEGTGHCDRNKD